MKQVILALDIGSSSVRCSAYAIVGGRGRRYSYEQQHGSRGGHEDCDNEERNNSSLVEAIPGACASRKLRLVQPNTGKIHCAACLQAIDECIDEVLLERLFFPKDSDSSENYHVVAVGISCFVMNLVGIDCHGELVVGGDETEAASISYACNTKAVADEVRHLKRELGEDAERQVYQKTGAPIHSAYALAQLRVLYRDQPEVTDKIAQWQTLPSLCLRRWSNRQKESIKSMPISYSEASWTGLLNFHTCQYESTVLDFLPEACRKALPPLADFDDESWLRPSTTDSPYAERWPMLQMARFFLGIGDGACANVGSKCWTPNRIACTVGTSAAARICLPLDINTSDETASFALDIPPGLFCYRIDQSHVLVGGALTDGGSVVEWTSQLLNLSTDVGNDGEKRSLRNCMDQVKALLEADYTAENDSNNNDRSSSSNVVVAPFLSGERSTGYRSGATGAMFGLTRDTTPAHFLKASIEGVTMRILAIIKLLVQCIPQSNSDIGQERLRIMASGKALEVNGLWRQMIADATAIEVVWDESTQEGTSRGVACLVAMALSSPTISKGLMYPKEEEVDLAVTTVSSPRGEGAKRYWERAAAAQDDLIHALSPLYSNETT